MHLKKLIFKYGEVFLALISITLVTFLVVGGFSQFGNYTGTRTYNALNVSGEPLQWDLSYNNFEESVYRLEGTYYYPDELLLPEDIDEYEAVPIEADANTEYLTQRFIIKVPQNGQAYKISMEGDQWAGAAYSNGMLADSSGTTADNSDDIQVGRDPLTIYASPDEEGYIDLIINVAAFRHYNIKAEPLIAYVSLVSTDIGYVFTPVDRSFDPVLVGMYMGFCMFALALFFTHITQTEYLWIAIICAFMAMRSGVEGATFSEAIPIAGEDFIYYMFYVGQPVIMLVFIMYFNSVFANVISEFVVRIFAIVTVTILVIIGLTSPVVFTEIVAIYNILTPIVYLVFLIPFIIKMRNFWPEHIISLFGMAALMVSALIDFINIDNINEGTSYSLTDTSMLLLIVTQLIYLFMANRRRTLEAVEYSRIMSVEQESLKKLDTMKTEFLANISHELKTPLAVISGYAQTGAKAIESGGDSADVAKKMRLVSSEAERMALMVSQLLDVTRIEEGRMVLKLQPTQLDAMIKTTLDAYCPALNKNKNKVVFNRVYDLPPVNMDEGRIRQVLVNLVANAMRHTTNGEVRIDIQDQENCLRVCISDTGKGIAKEQLATLFERFSKKEAGSGVDSGTGLGLFICKHIVEAHGGKIYVESELSRGTAVYFTIPKVTDDLIDTVPEE